MKTFKKLTSLLMAIVMILTMLSVGMTSLASIVVSKTKVTTTTVVPELIYLKPGANTFQYYIAGAAPGSTPASTAASAGQISFSLSKQATTVSLSYAGANSITLDNTSAGNTSTLTANISAGTMASATQDGVITWTFTYVIDGQTFHSYAYTYVYAPFMNQAGAQGGYKYKTSIGNEPTTVAYAFLTGINGTFGGPYRSLFVGTSGKTMNPILDGWGNSNVPSGTDDGYFTDYESYFTKDSNGGISAAGGRTRDDSKKGYFGNANGGGYLNVDTSRYAGASFSAFPNFKAGWMIQRSKDSSERHELESFKTSDSSVKFATSVGFTNGTSGEAYYGYAPTGTVPTENTTYTVVADFGFERSSSSHVHLILQFGLKINLVDKSGLRSAVSTAMANNYQDFEYSASTYELYLRYLKFAASALGNPASTTEDITTATNYLSAAVAQLTLADCTVTVNHKLPAADGFKYNYNGTEYTAANGYVTITETKGFEAGSDITVSKETFSGYSYSGTDATRTYQKQPSSLTVDYVYTAATSVLNFNYGAGLDSYVLNGETKTKTVTYGQPYGTLPAPQMDGYRFVRWADGSGTAVSADTVCKMISTSQDLTAVWNANFAGGHGVASDPFLIANTAQLDNIDDATAYCVINDGSCTKGKYYKLSADITYNLTKTPVVTFNGTLVGDHHTIVIPATITVADTTNASIFATVSGATISDINVTLSGAIRATGSGTTYAGFFGNVVDASAISDIQIAFAGTVSGANAGTLAGNVAAGCTVQNSAVTLNGGTLSGDAFIGTNAGTLTNTWALLKTEPTGFSTCKTNNIMRIRENGTAAMAYADGQYTFTASANSGWSVQYRDAADAVVTNGAVYSPAASADGEQDYVCFVQTVSFVAGSNGTLTGADSHTLRQGQTVTGLVPNAYNGYTFSGWTNPTNGTFSDSSPYTYTMGTTIGSGTITANFGVNTYTLCYDANAGGAQLEVPATMTYPCTANVIVAPEISRTGYTFLKWNTKSDASGTTYNAGQQYGALSAVNGSTVTLYAIWQINTYTVSFMTNCELQVEPVDVEYGKSVTFPNLSRTGYRSVEWCTDAGLTGAGSMPGTTKSIYGRTTFYAKWTPISYTISFSAAGATNVPDAVVKTYDDAAWTLPASYVPEKAGYNFRGWDTAVGGNGTRYYALDTIPAKMSTVDGDTIVLYAQWQAATYNITWDLTGGTINSSSANPTSVVTFGGNYTLPVGTMEKAGYAFKGWYTAATEGTQVTNATTVTITADTAVYAQWIKAGYTVAFDPNGGTGSIESIDAVCGTAFTLPANTMTRLGYSFTGWNTEPNGSGVSFGDGALVERDLANTNGVTVTLYAQWSGSNFSVAFNFNGVSGSMIAQTAVMDGAAITLRKSSKTTVTMSGSTYKFYGWAYNTTEAAAMQVAFKDQASFALTEEILAKSTVDWTKTKPTITLYAVWARNATVTWNLVGGTLDGNGDNFTTVVTYGDNFVLPTGEVAKSRYAFSGWFTSLESGTGSEITNDTVKNTNDDMTVYAHWVQTGALDSTYTTQVFMQNADGSYSATPTYSNDSGAEIGSTVSATVGTYTGYTFDESNANNVLSGTVLDAQLGTALVLKLYYTINTYTVTFHANNGEGEMAPQSFKYNTADDLNPCTFTRTGYAFSGWSRTATGSVAYSNGGSYTIGAANADLYAVWTAQTYTITFDSGVATITAQYGAAISAPQDPEKAGYTFNGWLRNGTAYTIPSTMPAESFSLVADWTQNTYTVTYNANGGEGTMNPQNFIYGQSVTLTANAFTKVGHKFSGWARTADGAVSFVDSATFTAQAADLNLFAVWTANTYSITFDSGVAKITAAYNAPIQAPQDPVKTGYTFGGWLRSGVAYTIPSTMPAEDIELTADWTAKTYTVTFHANGGTGTMNAQTVTYGVRANLTENGFAKVGYTFGGWAEEQNGTVVFANKASYTVDQNNPDNLDLYAAWTPNTYTVEFRGNGATGGAMDSMLCTYDVTYALTANAFVKTGFAFQGWASTETGTVLYQDAAQISNLTADANGRVTLFAVWNNVDYTVSFNANGATTGSAPEEIPAIYGQSVTLPSGGELAFYSDDTQESRIFAGWKDSNNVFYAAGSTYTCPASDVEFTAVWGANYYALDAAVALVEGYLNAGVLPANAANDPLYVADGDIAVELGFDGVYDMSFFNTEELETALAEASSSTIRNYTQAQQSGVDALTTALNDALNGLALLDVDYDYRFACENSADGYYDEMTGMIYPPCEDDSQHSFNSIIELIDAVLNADENDCLYESDSVDALRLEIHGNGSDIPGLISEAQSLNLKVPAQDRLGEYVVRMATAYHTMLVIKDADYSAVDALIDEYLPSLNGVTFDDLLNYYTSDTVSVLVDYYNSIDRTYKIAAQSVIDDEIVPTLQGYIDALSPSDGNYIELFNLILTIPKGTEGYSYPASLVSMTVYDDWMAWAQGNTGAISDVLDTAYLTTRYTESSVSALNRALNNVDWTLNIFSQNTINGADNQNSYAAHISSAISGLERRTYTLTFMFNDGTENSFYVVRGNYYGDKVTFPMNTPERSDYTFLGWAADPEGTTMLTELDVITENMVAYAIWEETPEQEIDLIAKEGSSTVIEPETGFIYGLKVGVTVDEIEEIFTSVLGNGHLEYETEGFVGTGTVVKLVDNATGETVKSYEIVIFGDVNGDGVITSADISLMKGAYTTSVPIAEGTAYRLAADLNGDGLVNAADISYAKAINTGSMGYNQATRTAE